MLHVSKALHPRRVLNFFTELIGEDAQSGLYDAWMVAIHRNTLVAFFAQVVVLMGVCILVFFLSSCLVFLSILTINSIGYTNIDNMYRRLSKTLIRLRVL